MCQLVKLVQIRRQATERFDGRPEVRLAKMRVAQGHVEGLMPQDFLDLFQRAASRNQVTRLRVAQIVKLEV